MTQQKHPVAQHDVLMGTDSVRTRDWLVQLRNDIHKDANRRHGWEQNLARWQRRRYGLDWRNPQFPWENSSDIVMPFLDKKIDELKPQYVNLIFAANPPITVHAMDAESQANVARVETWFQWMFFHRSPRFKKEMILGVDDLLETGRGIWKTFWYHEIRRRPETLTLERLPLRLASLVVLAQSPAQADRLSQLAQERGMNMAVLTPKEFERLWEPQILPVVKQEFDLSEADAVDRKALSDIRAWMRDGARDSLTMQKRDAVLSSPAINAIHPIDLIVPDDTSDVDDAMRITHRILLTETQLRSRVSDGLWSKAAVEKILEKRKTPGNARESKSKGRAHTWTGEEYREDLADMEGLLEGSSDLYEVWETCTYFSERLGQPDKKVVVLDSPDLPPGEPIRMRLYERDEWPYRTATFELNKKRWHSPRGIPKKLEDVDKEITVQHRMKLNRASILTAPTFKYRVSAGINPDNFDWVPGGFYPVRDMGDLEPMQLPPMDLFEEREEQILRTWGEEYIGGTDFGLSNPLSNLQEARTAKEIGAIENKARIALSLRGELYYEAVEGIARDFFDMWHMFGPNQDWVRVTSSEPMKITLEELQGKYLFQLAGTIGEQDKTLEAQKALLRLQFLAQVKQQGLAEPTIEIDLGEALKDWLRKDDIRVADRVLRERSPEEIQQIVQRQQAQEEAARKALVNEEQSPQELQEGLQVLKQQSPNKGAQKISLG